MALAGHTATLSLGGTPTAMTDAATVALSSTRYQVADDSKQVLSPAHSVTVKDDGVALAADAFTVDYFFGIVTLDSAPAGVVTISATYVPLLAVAECSQMDLTHSKDEAETNFLGTAEKSSIGGQRVLNAQVVVHRLLDESFDGASGDTWEDLVDDDTPKLLESTMGTRTVRAWGWFPSLNASASPGDVIGSTVTFRSTIRRATGRSETAAFGFNF